MMDIRIRTSVFNYKKGVLAKTVNLERLLALGFRCSQVDGDIDEIITGLTDNRAEIVIADSTGVDKERFSMIINLIYVNYCKNIVVITDGECQKMRGIKYLSSENLENFDLKLGNVLLEIKKKLEEKPSHNIALIKGQLHDYLTWFKISPRYSGFQYFLDACTMTYLNYPDRSHIVRMYDEIGKKYGKSGFAIEKAMRTALSDAIKTIRNLPSAPENKELKEYIKREIGNLSAISIIVSKLLVDKRFGSELYMKP